MVRTTIAMVMGGPLSSAMVKNRRAPRQERFLCRGQLRASWSLAVSEWERECECKRRKDWTELADTQRHLAHPAELRPPGDLILEAFDSPGSRGSDERG